MVAPKGFAWSFRDVAVLKRDRVYLAGGHDPSAEEDRPMSYIFRWSGSWQSRPFPVDAVGICFVTAPELNVLMLGMDGRVIRWGAKDFSEEQIDVRDGGTARIGDMREIRTIAGRAYAVGMRRMVYRCEGQARWTRLDAGVRCDPNDTTDAGFNSIDGFSESDIYAVGWEGEIWHFDGNKWSQKTSPTNLALFRVVCADDGKVYACGQMGLLLAGRGDQWETIEHSATEETFWGGVWFKDRLFLSSDNGLFVLQEGELLPIEIQPADSFTITMNDCFYRLDANDEVMWSVGQKMVLYTEDGVTWTETPYE